MTSGGGYLHASVGHAMGYSHAGAGYAIGGDARSGGYAYGAGPSRHARNNAGNAHARSPRGGANLAGGNYTHGFDDFNSGLRRGGRAPGYPDGGRGGMQYAGAITPVSAESRAVPRPPANAPVRAGSIRADVARYNEERGSSRAMQRQSEDPRQPEGSPYRN